MAMASGAEESVRIIFGINIRMRDGVRLNATLYEPVTLGATPCIVALTPYTADTCHTRAISFCTEKLRFLVVDVRGRGDSEGRFQPFRNEANDGYDTIEWVANQPFCDGNVGMYGSSYLGHAQWMTAKESPPHLRTIVPAASPHLGSDFPMRANIQSTYLLRWLTLVHGKAAKSQTYADATFWRNKFRSWYRSGRSFRDLFRDFGDVAEIAADWLDHPTQDAFWDAHNPSESDYSQINIPVLIITGSYDDDQLGALIHYRKFLRNSSPEVRARTYLIIGPWNHSGVSNPQQSIGEVDFGAASVLDTTALYAQWYRWTMQGGPKPSLLRAPVSYYVSGANRWSHRQTLEQATARHWPLFLDSDGDAGDLDGGGILGSNVGIGPPDTYTFDPRCVSDDIIDAEADTDANSLKDQRLPNALIGRSLVYHSAPLQEDLEITGFFSFNAWISIDCPDTDLYVSVYEVSSDDSCIRLTSDAMRARYRKSLRQPKWIETATPLRYEFKAFTFISRLIKSGHRIRLTIAPIGRVIDAIFSERNFNSGNAVADESVEGARAVTARLHHAAMRPSCLTIPVGAATQGTICA
jgi:uncharacterized protein